MAGGPARSTLAVAFEQGGKPVAARFESFQAKVSSIRQPTSSAEITVDLASFRSGDASATRRPTASS